MKAPCSVLMVPEGTPPELSHVVAAADFSQPSAHAVSLATLLASRAGHSAATVVHVVNPDPLGFDAVEQQDVSQQFARFLSPLDLHDVDVRQVVEESGSVSGVALATRLRRMPAWWWSARAAEASRRPFCSAASPNN